MPSHADPAPLRRCGVDCGTPHHTGVDVDQARRTLLHRVAIALSLAPLAALAPQSADAAELPLLAPSDPAAKAVDYVEDASQAKDAAPGALCSNCSIYSGADGAATGTCTLFPGKRVRAQGWCKSWSSL